jgi:hypothetical protein
MARSEWTSNAISSVRDVLKDECDIVANYLFPITSVVFLGIGLISVYRGDIDNAKLGFEVGGGTGGCSLISKVYGKLGR